MSSVMPGVNTKSSAFATKIWTFPIWSYLPRHLARTVTILLSPRSQVIRASSRCAAKLTKPLRCLPRHGTRTGAFFSPPPPGRVVPPSPPRRPPALWQGDPAGWRRHAVRQSVRRLRRAVGNNEGENCELARHSLGPPQLFPRRRVRRARQGPLDGHPLFGTRHGHAAASHREEPSGNRASGGV